MNRSESNTVVGFVLGVPLMFGGLFVLMKIMGGLIFVMEHEWTALVGSAVVCLAMGLTILTVVLFIVDQIKAVC